MAPQLGGVFTGHVGAQQVAVLAAKHLGQVGTTDDIGVNCAGRGSAIQSLESREKMKIDRIHAELAKSG